MNNLIPRLKRRLFKKKGEKLDFKDVILQTFIVALVFILAHITSYWFGITSNWIFSDDGYLSFFFSVFFSFVFLSARVYWKE